MAEKKVSPTAVWGTTLFLTAVFLWAGWTKLNDYSVWEPLRTHYANWFLKTIGVLEITSALVLWVPKAAWIGAATLAVIAVGAVGTHLLYDSALRALPPALLLVSLSALAYYRFPRKSPPE